MLSQNSTAHLGPTPVGNVSFASAPPEPHVTPFWELERLIAAGCDRTEALMVIGARRNGSGRPQVMAARQPPRLSGDPERAAPRRCIS